MARQITITTPLGEDLLFVEMHGVETLGRLFSYDVTLHSKNEEIAINDILGQNVTINLELGGGEIRYFNGFVSKFTQSGRAKGGYAIYHAVISPWLWFLTRAADCQIFQEMTVPDIIKEVFNDNGFSDYEDLLSGSYPTWEYCVQYRETDFNFISRLMEQEGIYYYFKHEDGKHQLVLADAYSSHEPIKGDPTLPYHLPDINQTINVEHISNWIIDHSVQPGTFSQADYNFKTPQNKLRTSRIVQRDHAHGTYEVFDYPGEYTEASPGEQYTLERIEELHVGFEQLNSETDARNMASGGLFTLAEHPRADQNREYLAVSTNYWLSLNEHSSGVAADSAIYSCSISAIESQTPFRAARSTPKPHVQGPQTAVVVGPAGEEIYPDEFGRVKVQFHWDRYGTTDENSSCWLRVAQAWAGAGWGTQYIPRIGHEVIVAFLEGDPDRPLVTGNVYNADNMPPYSLPDNKTQSGIKSRSSSGGSASNFNELRMEDKKGSEELYIQAEKDENILVKNCKTETVGVNETVDIGNDQTLTVGNDQTNTIGNNQTESIGNNRSETVGSNETLAVGVNRTRTVGANESISVGSNRTHTVGVNESITVGVAQEITVGGLQAITVGAAQTVEIGAMQNIDVGANQSVGIGASQTIEVGSGQTISVGGDRSLSVGKNRSASVADDDSLSVGKKLVIEAGDEITIKCGKASITLKKDGTIKIGGKDVTMKGSGKIDIKATKNIKMKGKKILQN